MKREHIEYLKKNSKHNPLYLLTPVTLLVASVIFAYKYIRGLNKKRGNHV